jgi:phosphate uptake regulator
MESRKLVKAGESSHTIALPKQWLDKHGLQKGDDVIVEEEGPALILTPTPRRRQVREITICSDNKSLGTLQRELTAAYLNNCSTVTITGKNIAHTEVRKMLHHFVALEVTEQTGTRIVAKDFLNVEELAIDKTLRRMDMMIRSMLEDAAEGKNADVMRDEDINRLYFLLARILRRSIEEPALAQKLGLRGTAILNTWAVMNQLEQLGDAAQRVLELTAHGRSKKIISCIKLVHEHYLNAMKAYHDKNAGIADKVAEKRLAISKQLAELEGELAFQLNTMTSLCTDIARAVIDDAPLSAAGQ